MKEFGGLTFSDREPVQTSRFRYFGGDGRSLLRAAVAALALCGLSACKSADDRALEEAQRAEALAQAGDLVGAQRAITEALALREDGPNFQQLAGAIALQRGDLVGAYGAFTRALESDASNQLALAYVANLGVQIGRIRQAEEAANRLLTLQPDAQPGLQVKGMIALSRGDLDEADGFAERLLAGNSADEAGSIIKARVLAKRGQAEDALNVIDNALRASPDSMGLLSNKVQLHRFLKQPEQMAVALDRLSAKGGALSSVALDRINLLYKLGRQQQAREAGVAFLREGSADPSNYRILQRIWWQYDSSPIQGPALNASGWKDPLAIVYVARYLLARGQQDAVRALTASANPEAANLVASLRLRASGQSGAALESQVDALLKDDEQDVDALLLKSQLAQKAGNRQAALEAVQRAIANDPLGAEVYVVAAKLYQQERLDWRARQLFEEGLKKLPQDFHLVQAYTQYLHELGDRGRAVSVARNFARALPSSEAAWSLLLSQCRSAGDEGCAAMAQSGLSYARTAYDVDDPPGTPVDRGLFGRI
jgi:tetratricopeptide (TPR) repeat protein